MNMDLQNLPIELTMVLILLGICAFICFLSLFLSLDPEYKAVQTWLPPKNNLAKHQFEVFALHYTAIWIGAFALVILWQAYEQFTADSYLMLCVPLAAPFLLQPILFPLPAERNLPFYLRYSFKANLWLAIFSFIGSYWYTHYFYSVLSASYTFPAHRLNDVPIALYFAAHFYFVTYHTFSNMILRRIESRYLPGVGRTVFFWTAVIAFSYFTAFMETLTISSFPYYSFKDRYMAYTLGSAFYGIYFIVSFPVFYRLDEKVGLIESTSALTTTGSSGTATVATTTLSTITAPHTLFQTCADSLGTSMLVLLLLDFCRLFCGIELNIGGVGYYIYPGGEAAAAAAHGGM